MTVTEDGSEGRPLDPALTPCGRPRPVDYALLALFVVFCICMNLLWLQYDQRPPTDDDKRHLSIALAYYRTLHASAPLGERLTRLALWDCNLGDGYPPGLYAWATAVFSVTGPSIYAALLSVQSFLVILLFACFELGFIFGGRVSAYALVALVGGSQVVIAGTREFLLDLPMTALTTLAYLLLLRSEHFTRRAPSILFGLVFGLSMLMKWSTALVLIAPALYLVWPLLRRLDYDVLTAGLLSTLGVLNGMLLARRYLLDHDYGLLVKSGPLDLARVETVTWLPPFLWIVGSVVAMAASWRMLTVVARSRPAATPLRNCFEGLLAAQLVAAPWYVWQLSAVLWLPVRAYLPSFSTWANARADALIVAVQAPMLTMLVGIGLAVPIGAKLLGRRSRFWQGPSFLGGLVGFLFLGFGVLTHWRYTMPLIPFVGIVATYWLSMVGRIAWVEVAVLLAHAVFQWAGWLLPLQAPMPPPQSLGEFLIGQPVACMRPDTRPYNADAYVRYLDRLTVGQDGAPPGRLLVVGNNLTVSTFCCIYQMLADYEDLSLRLIGLMRMPGYWALMIYSDEWMLEMLDRHQKDVLVLVLAETPEQLKDLREALGRSVDVAWRGRKVRGRLELLAPVVGPPPDPRLLEHLGRAHLFRGRLIYD